MIGVLIGSIVWGLSIQFLREKTLVQIGEKCGSEKILGKWYVILPEEKYVDILTKSFK